MCETVAVGPVKGVVLGPIQPRSQGRPSSASEFGLARYPAPDPAIAAQARASTPRCTHRIKSLDDSEFLQNSTAKRVSMAKLSPK